MAALLFFCELSEVTGNKSLGEGWAMQMSSCFCIVKMCCSGTRNSCPTFPSSHSHGQVAFEKVPVFHILTRNLPSGTRAKTSNPK